MGGLTDSAARLDGSARDGGAARPASVSVVITTRNRLAWLQQCLGSVLSQRGVHLSVIVVNDASDDGTQDWLDSFGDARVRAIHHNPKQERAVARNAGLAAAPAPFVMFLDDDDQLWPGALATLASALEQQPSAVAAVGARQAWFVTERFRRREPHPRRPLLRDIRRDVIFGWCPTGGQVLIRREAARAVGGYVSEFIPCEDRDFWQKLSVAGRFAFVPDTVLTYRPHPGQRVDPQRDALRRRVARRGISALPRPDRRRALLVRRAKDWCDHAERSLMAGRTIQGLIAMARGFAASRDIITSPLLGEWVVRWLVGRGLRFYVRPRHVEREGASPTVWRCSPGALAFHPDAPVVPPGVKSHPILVQVSGGAGNQLFQHAAALVLAAQTGSSVAYVASDSPLRARDPGLELFVGPQPAARVADLVRFGLPPVHGLPRLRHRWRRLANRLQLRPVVWRDQGEYPEKIERPLIGSGILLAGYFQSLDWIGGALDHVGQEMLRHKPAAVRPRPDVIAINLRTGKDFHHMGWVLALDYYRGALARHDPARTSPVWVVGDVDDDRAKVAQMLAREGWTVESAPIWDDRQMVNDFWRIAAAGTVIMANSTFAWWAAVAGDYLYAPQPRRVIMPDPWQPAVRTGLRRPHWITHDARASTSASAAGPDR